MDEFAGDLAQDVYADQGPVVPAEHELDEPFGRPGDGPPRVGGEASAPDLVVDALPRRFLLSEPDAGDLWDRVDAGRDDRIDGFAARDAERVAHRDAPLLHRRTGQRGRADDISGGVDARSGRPVAVVDNDAAAGVDLDAHLLEPESFGVARASGREQQPLRPDLAAVVEGNDQPVRLARDPVYTYAETDIHAHRLEDPAQVVGELGVDVAEQAVGAIDQGDLRAERGEDRRVLAADRAAADDHDARRRMPDLEHALAVEDVRVVERDPGRVERPGPGRDQHGFPTEHPPEATRRLDNHVAV